jgi:hypothetical protein
MDSIQVFDQIKNNSNSISENNISNLQIITLQCKILFKRRFGKKLAFLSGLCEDNSEIEIILKECKDNNWIKTSKVGNIYKYTGYFRNENGKTHFVPMSIETIFEAENADELYKTRLIIQNSQLKPVEEKCLCKKYKNEKVCDTIGCPFRHFFYQEKLKNSLVKN